MFRDNELFAGKDGSMHRRDIEKFAFLYLCGERDRKILVGEERMTFQDFDRLCYITNFLGLDQMNLEIWSRFSPQFKEQFEAVGRLLEENCKDMEFREYDDDIRLHNKWLAEFCAATPNRGTKEYLIHTIDTFHEHEKEKREGQADAP